ncbi:PQQ-dependent sugar dehydrogenase [Herbaspirillum sp. LeCh32-8]|uniref:PQQ-dependent sugar dehydrogenase n=1 Tax=Herbaspirillum sp. LeCh32-8 TaxID=2821356 RepID=UPI001AE5BC7A|nr:PQQ-dependent sugar dehydrogenase [Herbaspirillum sp. LeCh32-8]MBP0598609.1 PQQ-dependent sugar dehydrogenase [Herbaspirillum sp. LeCh32-8]
MLSMIARTACALAVAALAATVAPPAPAQQVAAAPKVVATGLNTPWSIAFFGKTPLVSERGTARIMALGANGAATEVATIAGVDGRGEGGLLGIAVHEGYLYAYFTAGAENRIERYKIDGDGVNLKLGPAKKIIGGIPAASYHNGGRIAFGPDGMLYASTGDAGERSRSQDLKSLAGKILRMTPDGGVPKDNPFSGSFVYSYGHRNVQGMAWAPGGIMYASEFGENTWDELNLIRAGGSYGWPVVEGKGGDKRFIDPLQQWSTSEASPSGMAIVGGNIYIANLRGQRLRKIPLSATGTANELYVRQYGRLRDAVAAPDGTSGFSPTTPTDAARRAKATTAS